MWSTVHYQKKKMYVMHMEFTEEVGLFLGWGAVSVNYRFVCVVPVVAFSL